MIPSTSLHGFEWQPQHKVKLHTGVTALKGNLGSPHNLFFRNTFIDDIPQPLGTGFRGEGQAAFPNPADFFQQFSGKVIHPQRGQRKIDMGLLGVVDDFVQHLLHLGMVGGGQGCQRHFLITGGIAEGLSLAAEGIRRFGPDRPVDESRLAEPAAPDAASHHFQYSPVMDNLGVRHDKGFQDRTPCQNP